MMAKTQMRLYCAPTRYQQQDQQQDQQHPHSCQPHRTSSGRLLLCLLFLLFFFPRAPHLEATLSPERVNLIFCTHPHTRTQIRRTRTPVVTRYAQAIRYGEGSARRLNKPVPATRLCNTLEVAGANNSAHLSNTGRSCFVL